LKAHVVSLAGAKMAMSFIKEPAMIRLIAHLPPLSDRFVFRSTLLLWMVAVLLG
jgi:hypothetical protein